MSRRVADMTGLNVKTAEMWQTQNYGIGGQNNGDVVSYIILIIEKIHIIYSLIFSAHFDFISKDSKPLCSGNGNRVATALFYVKA